LATSEVENDEDVEDRIEQFLPHSGEELQSAVETWSDAYLALNEEGVAALDAAMAKATKLRAEEKAQNAETISDTNMPKLLQRRRSPF